jgi:hypothetical protein
MPCMFNYFPREDVGSYSIEVKKILTRSVGIEFYWILLKNHIAEHKQHNTCLIWVVSDLNTYAMSCVLDANFKHRSYEYNDP